MYSTVIYLDAPLYVTMEKLAETLPCVQSNVNAFTVLGDVACLGFENTINKDVATNFIGGSYLVFASNNIVSIRTVCDTVANAFVLGVSSGIVESIFGSPVLDETQREIWNRNNPQDDLILAFSEVIHYMQTFSDANQIIRVFENTTQYVHTEFDKWMDANEIYFDIQEKVYDHCRMKTVKVTFFDERDCAIPLLHSEVPAAFEAMYIFSQNLTYVERIVPVCEQQTESIQIIVEKDFEVTSDFLRLCLNQLTLSRQELDLGVESPITGVLFS